MSDFGKNRVLALYKILTAYTDEQHQISMQDILVHMDAEGYCCSKDSILRYIKQLRNELGVDVISGRGRNARYTALENSNAQVTELTVQIRLLNEQ